MKKEAAHLLAPQLTKKPQRNKAKVDKENRKSLEILFFPPSYKFQSGELVNLFESFEGANINLKELACNVVLVLPRF